MTGPVIALVVAAARNGVIGAQGGLPWRQRTDLKHFKSVTLGKAVVMGSATWRSLPGVLTGRDNIVLSRDSTFRPQGAWVLGALESALAFAEARSKARGRDELCIIGGADIFRQVLPRVRRVYLTTLDGEPEGDVFLPNLGPGWREVESRSAPAGPQDDYAMRFSILERDASAAER